MQTRMHVFIPQLIISGGQTGADFGALLGARSLGIPTGGICPRGCRTERGPNPELLEFGLIESIDSDYGTRTEENIELCDVVICVASNFNSPGTARTREIAVYRHHKPYFAIQFASNSALEADLLTRSDSIRDVRAWLRRYEPDIINFAGNRESKAPGIQAFTSELVRRIFS